MKEIKSYFQIGHILKIKENLVVSCLVDEFGIIVKFKMSELEFNC